jgi:hypothetical protein
MAHVNPTKTRLEATLNNAQARRLWCALPSRRNTSLPSMASPVETPINNRKICSVEKVPMFWFNGGHLESLEAIHSRRAIRSIVEQVS